jgi:endonuclease YncB( thermonuclease family)
MRTLPQHSEIAPGTKRHRWPAARSAPWCDKFVAVLSACGLVLVAGTDSPAIAGGCIFESQGEGHVAEIIDGRNFRLTDGREIRLSGIELASSGVAKESRAATLSAIIAGKDVALRGADDTPDRYGRQNAFVLLIPSETLVQDLLLAQGAALVSPEVSDRECLEKLMAAEAEARRGKKGLWSDPTVIKNAESPDDILAWIGRFTVVEGKVLSVRQSGATTYLNFGRNFTRDFAVTISRRMIPAVESTGIALKSLENRRIRVRGWVEARPSPPRMQVHHAGQIEVVGGS